MDVIINQLERSLIRDPENDLLRKQLERMNSRTTTLNCQCPKLHLRYGITYWGYNQSVNKTNWNVVRRSRHLHVLADLLTYNRNEVYLFLANKPCVLNLEFKGYFQPGRDHRLFDRGKELKEIGEEGVVFTKKQTIIALEREKCSVLSIHKDVPRNQACKHCGKRKKKCNAKKSIQAS